MYKSNYYKKLGRAGWNDEEHTPRQVEDDFYNSDYLEKPSIGKKRKKKPTPKKTDHKHEYLDVVCVYNKDILGRPIKTAVIRKKCVFCGKLDGWKHPTIWDEKLKRNTSMTTEQVLKIYSSCEVIYYD